MPGHPHGAFVLFGGQHCAALALTAGVAVVAVALSRRRPELAPVLGRVVGLALLASGLGYVVLDASTGTAWRHWLPLHLCDLVVFIGAAALWTRRPLLAEMTYFWGLAGALPAMLTPDLPFGFPDFHFVFYFLQHGLIVVCALMVASAPDLRPRAWAPLRLWLWLNLAALPVGLFDVLAKANFMYLRAKPPSSTPLDWFGVWPMYIVAGEVVALVLFGLLHLPFVLRGRRQSRGRHDEP